MREELENKLSDKYSFMQRTGIGIYDRYGCQCNDGWYDLIDQTCANIQAVYDSVGKEPDIQIVQIKEKFGTLRIYYHFEGDGKDSAIQAIDIIGKGCSRLRPGIGCKGLYDKIFKIVSSAEKRSAEICERCGKRGELRTADYYQVLCDECFEKETRSNYGRKRTDG